MSRFRHSIAAIKQQAPALLGLLGLTLIGIGLNLLKPWPVKLLIDHALKDAALPEQLAFLAHLPGAGTTTGLILWLVSAGVFIFVAAQLILMLKADIQVRTGGQLHYNEGGGLYRHLLNLSPLFHARAARGDLLRRTTVDSGYLRDRVMRVALPALTAGGTWVTMLYVMWRLDPQLALLALAISIVTLLLAIMLSRSILRHSHAHQQAEGSMIALADETLGALPHVQAHGGEKEATATFRTLSEKSLTAYLRATDTHLGFRVAAHTITAVSTAAVLGLGSQHVLQGQLTLGSLFVYLAYLAAFFPALRTLANLVCQNALATAREQRATQLLEETDHLSFPDCGQDIAPAKSGSTLTVDAITFGYPNQSPALNDLSLKIESGETLALKGPPGSGKTTLLMLMSRLIDPESGRILIDDTDLSELSRATLRRHIALVPQDPFLLPCTVAENIICGRPASATHLAQALADAQATDFVARLPHKEKTPLGEAAQLLSGGERQRLAIARALYGCPTLLLLDEPTSALDSDTEQALMAALRSRPCTTLLVSHRPSTIRQADRILTLGKTT